MPGAPKAKKLWPALPVAWIAPAPGADTVTSWTINWGDGTIETIAGNPSSRNHTYARRPIDAHPGFHALWADGHGRQPSSSNLFFCDRAGEVRQLPREMQLDTERPRRLAD